MASRLDRAFPALVVSLVLGSCADSGPRDDVAEIRACHGDYMKALKLGNGQSASILVDSRTIGYFDQMVVLAIEADSMEVTNAPLLDRLAILGLRMHSEEIPLERMSGRDALIQAVETGAMPNNGMEEIGLGTIAVKEDIAQAPLTISGFPTPFTFLFRKEHDQWRIDITSLFEFMEIALGQMAKSNGSSPEEFVSEILMRSRTEPLPARVWHRPLGTQY